VGIETLQYSTKNGIYFVLLLLMKNSKKHKILVIEDDADVLAAVESILTVKGFEVYTSSTGLDAMSLVEEKKPSLVITDIFLGDVDGRIICQSIKNNPQTSHIPIIIISGKPEIYNTIQHVGANDVVLKPFNHETLLQRVERQLCA